MTFNSLRNYILDKKRLAAELNLKLELQDSNLRFVIDLVKRLKTQKNRQRELAYQTDRATEMQFICEDLQSKLDQVNKLLANTDKMTEDYIHTLSYGISTIDLSRKESDEHRITKIPDLSRFFQLKTLDLSFQDKLVEGFDVLPVTIKHLIMKGTRTGPTVEWLSRLTNLTCLNLSNNSRVTKLPDLSVLQNLKELIVSNLPRLTELPNLPFALNSITITYIPDKYLTYGEYRIHKYQTRKHNPIPYIYEWGAASEIVYRINRVNRFDAIRDELLSETARIMLNPGRIARILAEHGGWIGDCDAIMDVYDLQLRKRFHHPPYQTYFPEMRLWISTYQKCKI